MQTIDPSPFLDRFAALLTSLVAAVVARVGRFGMGVGLAEGVSRRIRRARDVVVALIRRLQAGALRSGARRAAAAGRGPMDAAGRARRAAVMRGWAFMPRRFGWLCPMVPCTERDRDSAALYGSQLAALLAEPEMRLLMAMAPGIGRALRPVCRMLAVDTALLDVAEVDVTEVRVAPVAVAPVVVEEGPPIMFWWQQKWAQ